MPVLLFRLEPNDVTRPDFLDGTAQPLHTAEP
jgi:hypothetical protein